MTTGTFKWNENPLDKLDDDDIIEAMEDAPETDMSLVAGTSPGSEKDLKKDLKDNGKFFSNVSKLPPFDYHPQDIVTAVGPIRISLQLDRTSFISSGNVDGFLQISCGKENNWKIGKIQTYLIGMEETLPAAKNKSNQRVFLTKWIDFQDASGVPTDAVHAGRPDEHGMYKAKQANTKFNFSIPIMKQKDENSSGFIKSDSSDTDGHLPSSFWSKKYGGVRYIVVGIVHIKKGSSILPPLGVYKEIFVSETLPYELKPTFKSMLPPTSPQMAEITEVVKNGFFAKNKKGMIKVNASVRLAEPEHAFEAGVWTAGSIGWVGIEIKNASARKVTDVTVSLVRRLKTFGSQDSNKAGITPTLSHIAFSRTVISQRILSYSKCARKSGMFITNPKSGGGGFAEDDMLNTIMDRLGTKEQPFWEGVDPDETRNCVIDLPIPLSARTVRYGLLVDVSFTVEITAKVHACNPIRLKMPVVIVHPLALLKELPTLQLNAENLGYISPPKRQFVSSEVKKNEDTEIDLDTESEAISAKEGTLLHDISELTIPSEMLPVAAEVTEVLPTPISRDTLLRKSKLGHNMTMPTRNATLTRNNPFIKNVSPISLQTQPHASTLSAYMTLRKANMPSLLSAATIEKDQAIPQVIIPPPPQSLPPSISALKSNTLRKESNATDVWKSSGSIELGEPENLKDVPTMDLENEIDKLFSCVPIE